MYLIELMWRWNPIFTAATIKIFFARLWACHSMATTVIFTSSQQPVAGNQLQEPPAQLPTVRCIAQAPVV